MLTWRPKGRMPAALHTPTVFWTAGKALLPCSHQAPNNWAAVKALQLSYQNGYIYIYIANNKVSPI